MTKTTNYNLNQWDAGDRVLRTDFNADNAAIDAALAAKADTSALTTLAAALGTGGKTCRIAWGTYTGTGNYGSSSKNSLTFDFMPVVVIITVTSSGSDAVVIVNGQTQGNFIGYSSSVSWSGNSVSWYNSNNTAGQLNNFGVVYRYAAIGY